MIPRQIYTYWEGQMPPFIRHCLRSIKDKAGVPVLVLDRNLAYEMVGDSLNPKYKKIVNISQKCDCIRVAILEKYGGMWCDADTIAIKPFGKFFNYSGFVGIKWAAKNSFLNGYFFSEPKSEFMTACLQKINHDLEPGLSYYPHSSGVYFGERLFNEVGKEVKKATVIPMETFVPVNLSLTDKVWTTMATIDAYLKEETVAIGLNFSHMGWLNGMSVAEIKTKKNLVGSIFNYPKRISIVGKEVSEKYRELLKTIPEDFGPAHPSWGDAGKLAYRQIWNLAHGGDLA